MLKKTTGKSPKSMGSFVRDWLIPRVVFLPYWINRCLLFLVDAARNLTKGRSGTDTSGVLCIEAGAKGWEIIEYQELYASACEYLGPDQVHRVIIDKDKNYLVQLKQVLDELSPTHYLYSPRTGSQNWVVGLYQSFRISIMLHWRDITPIAALTDLPVRTWRAQCAVVTAGSGIVVSLMSPKETHPIFPHQRIIGPCLMPFSETTMNRLNALSADRHQGEKPTAVFTGSLYEPRTSVLQKISNSLKERGLLLEMKGRSLENKRSPDSEYWQTLINASLVVTTADQIAEGGRDWAWLPHFIYRYTEVLICGRLLVAPDIPGIRRYYTPGVHFLAFSSPDQAVEVIANHLNNETELEKIAAQGKAKAQALVRSHAFWNCLDMALGRRSMT